MTASAESNENQCAFLLRTLAASPHYALLNWAAHHYESWGKYGGAQPLGSDERRMAEVEQAYWRETINLLKERAN